MCFSEIKEKLHYALLNEGIFIDDDDMDIVEYIPDSLAFVALIVQIECKFNIELPDEMLNWERMGSVNSLSLYLQDLLNSDSEQLNISETNNIQKL